MSHEEDLKNRSFKEAIENKPVCSLCSSAADYSMAVFEGIIVSKTLDVCFGCTADRRRMEETMANAARVRITSYTSGHHATGTPDKLNYLVESLTPRKGFRSITSAIRTAANQTERKILVCAACSEPISPRAPGFLRWTTDDNKEFHSIRLFHQNCWTNPGKTAGENEWADLEGIEKLDRSLFTIAAGEMLDQIEKKWKQLKACETHPETY